MPRIVRSQLDDGLFHVTARGNRGSAIFVDDLDRVDFLHLLETTIDGFDWRCRAHCLMGTHYHVVLDSSRVNLSDGMQRLNGMYARRFNRRHGFRGHVFEDRFSSWLMRDERHFHATLAYVRENPVRAGLCEQPEDWPWSG